MNYCHIDLRFKQANIKKQLSVTYIPFDGRKFCVSQNIFKTRGAQMPDSRSLGEINFVHCRLKVMDPQTWNVLQVTFLVPRMLRGLFLCSVDRTSLYNLFEIKSTRCTLGTAVAQWLRRCVPNRKVAGSIPDGVTGIFH